MRVLEIPPCRLFLIPASSNALSTSLKKIEIDSVIQWGDSSIDPIEEFKQMVSVWQDKTVALVVNESLIKVLTGFVTETDFRRFEILPDSFVFMEVGSDGRGVLHILNWGKQTFLPVTDQRKCRVFLFRHGQAMAVEEGGRVWSHHPIGLTALGREQASQASVRVQNEIFAAFYSSSLNRTAETAQKIAEPHGREVILSDELMEIRLGEFEGLTLANVHEKRDHRFVPWLEVTFNEEFPHKDFHHAADLVFPGGESILMVHTRVKSEYQRIVKRHLGEAIALVSHTWTIQPLLCFILGGSPINYFRFGLRYATDTIVEVDETGEGQLLALNANLLLDEVAGKRLKFKLSVG